MRNLVRGLTAIAVVMASHANAHMVPGSGPYNARFVPGGIGTSYELPEDNSLRRADASYTIVGWIKPAALAEGAVILSLGGETGRNLVIDRSGRLAFKAGPSSVTSSQRLAVGQWQHVAVVVTRSRVEFFLDGSQAGSGNIEQGPVEATVELGPVRKGRPHLAATLVGFGVDVEPFAASKVASLASAPPDFETVQIWEVGRGWPFQSKANIGLTRQQDAWTLPRSETPPSAPVSVPRIDAPSLQSSGSNSWMINGWSLAAAPAVQGSGEELSQPNIQLGDGWYPATVPGTVLQTLVDRGVYPDPYYGLNNMAIPESLARQDYWYRTEFDLPEGLAGRQISILLNGVNYESELWINGVRAGATRGAFIRGEFPFVAREGKNAVAIKVSPPPHPGIPHEELIAAGPGENGGQLAIDGPTFVASEGWDWIPGIRDRNTGLWQSVELVATGPVAIGDVQVITDLPLPRTDRADIFVHVPVQNRTTASQSVDVQVTFGGIKLLRRVTLSANEQQTVSFTPQLTPPLRSNRQNSGGQTVMALLCCMI